MFLRALRLARADGRASRPGLTAAGPAPPAAPGSRPGGAAGPAGSRAGRWRGTRRRGRAVFVRTVIGVPGRDITVYAFNLCL
jgi:hypothetical protein